MRKSLASLLFLTLSSAGAAQVQLPDKYFDSNGVRIHYVEAGRGIPVVLVHGFTRDITRNWVNTGVVEALAKRHRVVALDLRGHGKSANVLAFMDAHK